VSAIKNWR